MSCLMMLVYQLDCYVAGDKESLVRELSPALLFFLFLPHLEPIDLLPWYVSGTEAILVPKRP